MTINTPLTPYELQAPSKGLYGLGTSSKPTDWTAICTRISVDPIYKSSLRIERLYYSEQEKRGFDWSMPEKCRPAIKFLHDHFGSECTYFAIDSGGDCVFECIHHLTLLHGFKAKRTTVAMIATAIALVSQVMSQSWTIRDTFLPVIFERVDYEELWAELMLQELRREAEL